MADEHGLLARWKLVRSASVDPRLTRGDWGVLMVVLDRIDDATGIAWPGLSRIAADSGINRSSVVRSIRRLTAHGYLVRDSGDRKRSNRYRMGTPDDATSCSGAPRRVAAPSRSDAPSCTDGSSRSDALGVGASVHLSLGAAVHPELTQLNLPSEPAEAAATAKGARLPADWVLPDEWRSWAAGTRPDLDLDRTGADFADYWHAKTGKDATKRDWFATWRLWVRKERGQHSVPRRIADSFHDTTYTGTPLSELPDYLRPAQ